MNETLIEGEDMQWLKETTGIETANHPCAVIFGNEDCPVRVELYTKNDITARDKIFIYDPESETYKEQS